MRICGSAALGHTIATTIKTAAGGAAHRTGVRYASPPWSTALLFNVHLSSRLRDRRTLASSPHNTALPIPPMMSISPNPQRKFRTMILKPLFADIEPQRSPHDPSDLVLVALFAGQFLPANQHGTSVTCSNTNGSAMRQAIKPKEIIEPRRHEEHE